MPSSLAIRMRTAARYQRPPGQATKGPPVWCLRLFAGSGKSALLTAEDAKPDAKTAKDILASSLGVLGGSRNRSSQSQSN